jgi:hypothetical protein
LINKLSLQLIQYFTFQYIEFIESFTFIEISKMQIIRFSSDFLNKYNKAFDLMIKFIDKSHMIGTKSFYHSLKGETNREEIIITWILIIAYWIMFIKYLLFGIIDKPWILKYSSDFSLLFGESRYFCFFLSLLAIIGFLFIIQHIFYDNKIIKDYPLFAVLFHQIKEVVRTLKNIF